MGSELPGTDYTRKQALGVPKWTEAGRVHDWRNHVPECVRDLWNSFSDQQKLALLEWAENLSDREHWD